MRMEDRIAAARSAVGRLCTTHAHGQCETYTTTKDAHTQRSPAGPSVGRSDGVFSTPPRLPRAQQPNSPTAQQPNNPPAQQPACPTAQQPDSPAPRLPSSPTPRPRPRPRAPALTPQRAPTHPAHTRPPSPHPLQPPRPAHPRQPRQLRQAARTTARPRGASRGGGWGAALPSGRGARGFGRRGRSLGLLP